MEESQDTKLAFGKPLFQEIENPTDREAMLDTHAIYTDLQPVKQYFSQKEVDEKRAEAMDNNIIIRRAAEELEKAKNIYKEKTQKPIEDNIYLLNCCRHGFVETESTVYLIPDWENRTMFTYDRFGNFVSSRPMTPDERQTKIK